MQELEASDRMCHGSSMKLNGQQDLGTKTLNA
jgi:hypothetical protein